VCLDFYYRVVKALCRLIQLNLRFLRATAAPLRNCQSHIVSRHHSEKILANAARIFVQPSLTSCKSYTLKDFYSECAASDSTNHIDSIFLRSDILAPGTEDVTLFSYVSIVLCPAEVCFKTDLKTSQQAITLCNFFLQAGFQAVSFFSLFLFLNLTLLHKSASSVFFFAKI
jgi:hypothetical protein